MSRAFDLVAFDGDDTLWHNERSYRDARDRFRELLAGAGVSIDGDALEACITRTEIANLPFFGYGVSSFTLSLMETAIELTEGRIASRDLQTLVELARTMMSENVEVFPGAADTLAVLAASYPLVLITKGDLLHQTSKLERSGLQRHFTHVEVVSHKTPPVYQGILRRYGVDPSRFLMIGNSLRSDVLPVLETGGWAVHVPAALTWSHEHADPPLHRDRFFEAASLPEAADLIRSVELDAGSRA